MPTLTSDPIISSPRWGVPFCVGRSSGRRPPSSTGGSGQGLGCGRPLDRVAGWVGGCIAAVFFTSLERCWCVNVRTHDDLLDDEQRDAEAPLMFGGGSGSSTAGAGCLERRKGSWRSGKGRRAGGGMGCYGDF